MSRLTTHVLDTLSGIPAAGVNIKLTRDAVILGEFITNKDGRCERPILEHAPAGVYQLTFQMGDYFRNHGIESPFLDQVLIQFLISSGRDHHVPLVCSPYAYSTYRGS